MLHQMPRVFVSYRRADADSDAGRIADRLVQAFGEDNVFHDHEALKAGIPWQEQIDEALSRTDVTLVVIGPGWLTQALPDGSRRLDDAEDMVAYEIARSIERRIRIVPLLVRDATLPSAAQLPERLNALPTYQGCKVRNDSFAADVDRLVHDLSGRRRPVRMWMWASAAALAVAVGVGAWFLRSTAAPAPSEVQTTARMEERSGTLGLRIRLREAVATPADAVRFLLYVTEPVRISKAELSAPKVVGKGVLEIAEAGTLLPGRDERYEADIRRLPLSATLDRQAQHGRSSVCLVRTGKAPASNLMARIECDEGERCTIAPDNPGHFEICGARVDAGNGPRWSWMATVHAQRGGVADEAWVVPSIETLKRLRNAGTGPAFTEVFLSSPPLPALASAKHVSVSVAVNGRTALIDGLPPDASAVTFDAATGVRLSFGLENLDFAGAIRGHEQVDVTLRFLSGRTVVREIPLRLDYISLRDQRETNPVGKNELGIRWSAKYYSGLKDDRFQIFLTSSSDVASLMRVKADFDRAALEADVDGQRRPLVAVVRPPLGGNPNWGLNVGLSLPSGQIRFTFDDATSARLCRRMVELVREKAPHVRKDSYRRSVDGTYQYRQCTMFSQG